MIDYLNARERLTEADRARIIEGVFDELGREADRFLDEKPHPFLPDRFWYNFWLMTEAREVRYSVFGCSAAGHVHGVTEVLYAEERSGPDA